MRKLPKPVSEQMPGPSDELLKQRPAKPSADLERIGYDLAAQAEARHRKNEEIGARAF